MKMKLCTFILAFICLAAEAANAHPVRLDFHFIGSTPNSKHVINNMLEVTKGFHVVDRTENELLLDLFTDQDETDAKRLLTVNSEIFLDNGTTEKCKLRITLENQEQRDYSIETLTPESCDVIEIVEHNIVLIRSLDPADKTRFARSVRK